MIRQLLMGDGADVRPGDLWRWAWSSNLEPWHDADKFPPPPEPSVWIARPVPAIEVRMDP